MGAVRHSGFRLERGIVQQAPAPRVGQLHSGEPERHRFTVERRRHLEDELWEARQAAQGPLGYVGALRIVAWPSDVAVGPGSDVVPVGVDELLAELERDPEYLEAFGLDDSLIRSSLSRVRIAR